MATDIWAKPAFEGGWEMSVQEIGTFRVTKDAEMNKLLQGKPIVDENVVRITTSARL